METGKIKYAAVEKWKEGKLSLSSRKKQNYIFAGKHTT